MESINNTLSSSHIIVRLCMRGVPAPRKRSAKRETIISNRLQKGRGSTVKRYIFLKILELADIGIINHPPLNSLPMYLRGRKREREKSEEKEGRAGCSRCFIIKIGRRWRTLRANLFRQGKRPCLVVDDVRARRWRWYDQVIPLSELSVARGYLQSVFLFWFPLSPRFASPYLELPLLSSRLVTPSRSHRNGYERERERGLSRSRQTLMRDFTFLARNTNRRIHFCVFRRAAYFLPSIKILVPSDISWLVTVVTRENPDLIFFSSSQYDHYCVENSYNLS